MLLPARKKGESLVLGGEVDFVVLEIIGNRVRLGVTAPQDVPGHSGQVTDRIGSPVQRLESGSEEHAVVPFELLPTTQEIADVVADAISSHEGRVTDCSHNGRDLFLRAVVPMTAEVTPGDVVQNGVAVRTAATDVIVHQYVLRRVCRNGAIAPCVLRSQHVPRVGLAAPSEDISLVISRLRDAVEVCLLSEAFLSATRQMQESRERHADRQILSQLRFSGISRRRSMEIRADVLRRFADFPEASAYGLMNAITAAARSESDSQVKWRLEELGGAIPFATRPPSIDASPALWTDSSPPSWRHANGRPKVRHNAVTWGSISSGETSWSLLEGRSRCPVSP